MARIEQEKRKAPSVATADVARSDAQPESLDKVRDILFGGQMRTVESRLQGLEERLLGEQQAMRSEFAKQLAELDSFAKKELAGLADRVAVERVKRADELKALSSEIKEALRLLDKRHAKLEETTGMADADLRDQLLVHARAAAAELAKVSERLSAELSRSHTELKSAKTDRSALASLFTDLATRLGDAPAAPGKNGPRG
jgi:hypothetical protein